MKELKQIVLAVRFMQHEVGAYDYDIGRACAKFIEDIREGKRPSFTLSNKAYHYFSYIDADPGDFVIIQGNDNIAMGRVVCEVENDDIVRATRHIIAKIDFGPEVVARQKQAGRKALLAEMEKRIKAAKTETNVLEEADKFAEQDETLAALLKQFKELE